MTTPNKLITLLSCMVLSLPILAAETITPVRMGSGLMTFDTVPGWGLDDEGKSVLGPTHGGVVIDPAGSLYTSTQKGVVVFSPEGQVLRSFLGKK